MRAKTQRYSIREVVWCEFEKIPYAQKPEFINRHLCVIISTKNEPRWPHLVIPLTSQAQNTDDDTVYMLRDDVLHNGRDTWAVCGHIYAVAHSRLSRPTEKCKISERDFEAIKVHCCHRLPFIPVEKP